MAKDPTQGPVSRYDEMNQPVSLGQKLIEGKELREELIGRPVGELKQMAAKLKIPRYSKMRKAELMGAILKFYGFRVTGISIHHSASLPSAHPSPHPPMTAKDLVEPKPKGMSARVRRIRETSNQ